MTRAAVAAAMLFGVVAGSVASAPGSMAGSSATLDPAGDAVLSGSWLVPDGTRLSGVGDITSVSVNYTTATPNVKLSAKTGSLQSPAIYWSTGSLGTTLTWHLDTDGDGLENFWILYFVRSSDFSLAATVLTAPVGSSTTVRCNAIARYDGPPYGTTDLGYSAEFPASCIDSPTSVRAQANLDYRYDPESDGVRNYYPLSLDSAPDTGWTASVNSLPPPTPRLAAQTRPVVHGKHKVGKTLSITKPRWSAAPTRLTYRWYRSGKPIARATQSTYKIRKADRGKRLAVKVTASRPGFISASTTSSAVKISRA